MLSEVPEHELHQQLANDLAVLIQDRQHETESGEHVVMSFSAKLLDIYNGFTFCQQEDDGGYALYAGHTDFTPNEFLEGIAHKIHQSAGQSKWKDEIRNSDFEHDDSRNLLYYAALTSARKEMRRNTDPILRLTALMEVGLIALDTQPEDYTNPTKPKKHKHETDDEKVFRRAMSILIDASRVKTREGQIYYDARKKIGDNPRAFIDKMLDPRRHDLRKGCIDVNLSGSALTLVEFLASPEMNTDAWREESLEHMKWRRQNSEELTIPIEETDWTILPPGTLEQLRESGSSTDSSGEQQRFIDPERIKWLARVALSWGQNAYMAVANLQKTGDYDYRVAILPQLIRGVVVEHAVAENPASGNAAYVFRAERGLEDDGNVWLGWKDVLSDSKAGARALGARKIIHKSNFEENVFEYLTRHPIDLDKTGYKR